WQAGATTHYEWNGALADPVQTTYRAGRCAPLIAATVAVDADRDFVGNDQDNCPALANSSQSDSDADSLGDRCDACPLSDTSATLEIGGCDTRIPNRATSGCTLADDFAHCGQPGRKLIQKLRHALCVLGTAAHLRRANELRPREGAAIA